MKLKKAKDQINKVAIFKINKYGEERLGLPLDARVTAPISFAYDFFLGLNLKTPDVQTFLLKGLENKWFVKIEEADQILKEFCKEDKECILSYEVISLDKLYMQIMSKKAADELYRSANDDELFDGQIMYVAGLKINEVIEGYLKCNEKNCLVIHDSDEADWHSLVDYEEVWPEIRQSDVLNQLLEDEEDVETAEIFPVELGYFDFKFLNVLFKGAKNKNEAQKLWDEQQVVISKAHDEGFYTYADLDYIELYDHYDLVAKEPVPEMLLEAKEVKRGNTTITVDIDYPVVAGIFTLDGKKGAHFSYIEAGKKAFVRNGEYKHPDKGWSSEIVMMSPTEYIEACLKIFKKRGGPRRTVDELIEVKENEYDLFDVFDPLAGNLNYPVLELNKNQQEGLHRAIYAMRKGVKLIPVVVIR